MSSRGDKRQNRRGGRSGGNWGREKQDRQEPEVDESCPVIQTFRGYQVELDKRHDKYERLVKLSRDVTIESKRTIFLLHRITGGDAETLLAEGDVKLADIRQTKWRQIAAELDKEDPYQFLRAFSPGLQEYIEAVSFWYYLKHNSLISCQQVQEQLQFTVSSQQTMEDGTDMGAESSSAGPSGQVCVESDTPSDSTIRVHVPPMEYMLGVADLTGELMRMAINSVGKGKLDEPYKICAFMRVIYEAFVSYGNVSRELPRKLFTLKQSLQKVETACYTLQVRGSEIPKHMLADFISSDPVVYTEDISAVDN